MGTMNILEAMRKNKVNKIIYVMRLHHVMEYLKNIQLKKMK